MCFKKVVDGCEIEVVEAKFGGSNNGINLLGIARANYGASDRGIVERPGNGGFGGRALVEQGDFAQFIGQGQVVRETRLLKLAWSEPGA